MVRFDPETDMVRFLESMRYIGTDSEAKMLWINGAIAWGVVDGQTTATKSAATWFDEGTPWAVFAVEDIRYNVDVDDYIEAKGP